MKQALNAFYWLVIIALLIAGLIGCGLFRKNRQKDYSKTRSEIRDQTVIVVDQADSSGMKAQTVLELDIRIPRPQKGEPAPAIPDSAITTITEAIAAAIGKATRLKATVSSMKAEARQGRENRQENRDYEAGSDSVSKSSSLSKDSNTSMLANVPWYAWLGGIGGLLLLAYLVLKRYGVV